MTSTPKEFYCCICIKHKIDNYYNCRGFTLCELCMEDRNRRFPEKGLKASALYVTLEQQVKEIEEQLEPDKCKCCPCCDCDCFN